MTELPKHGPMNCRLCWGDHEGKTERLLDERRFRLVNDPGAWGSSNPIVLVLGQTKGNTQSSEMQNILSRGVFDQVAFKRFRPNLLKVLKAVGVLDHTPSVDPLLTDSEPNFGWGSVVRCSMTGLDEKTGEYSGDSGKVLPAYKAKEAQVVILTCMQKWLKDLPERNKLIVLLGNSDLYIRRMREKLRKVHPDTLPHPQAPNVAHLAAGRTWVHVGHPSGANGHLTNFLHDYERSGQGKKRADARRAVRYELDRIATNW